MGRTVLLSLLITICFGCAGLRSPTLTSTSEDFSDLETLGRAIGDARIVVLGEPSHGDGAVFLLKARVLRYLHQEKDFDVVAWESGLSSMEQVDSALATTMPMDSVEALGLLSFWRRATEVRATLDYVRASRTTSRPIRVIGFDNQNTAVDRAKWVDRLAAAFRIEPSLAARLRQQYIAFRQTPSALDSLATTLRAIGAHADATLPGLRTMDRQVLRRSVDDALVQVNMFQSAIGKRPRSFDVADNNPRDRRMAENLIWQANERFKGRRIVVWMASLHAAYQPSDIMDTTGKAILPGLVTTGELLREHFGRSIFSIAMSAGGGHYGSVYDSIPKRVPTADSSALESAVREARGDHVFINLRGLSEPHVLRTRRAAVLLGYQRTLAIWPSQFDGVLVVREMTPVTRASER